ncbi:MAG: 2-C-methyl-D-erythritol 2,4-cyclodiphosphate synthase [Bacteroidota bacterium]|nr:2-C-methyl-D-erythritol 2,4-cyclodiphosphate synthase [Bacteroidota bacterium]
MALRIGYGFDIHRLAAGRRLVLGGVILDEDFGCVAHSDGDVLVHAICDALLGAAALGDIGRHFPDDDEAYRDISSIVLLRTVRSMLAEQRWRIENIDTTVVLDRPKIASFRHEMARRIAEAADIPVEAVSIKATTSEGIGFIGRGEGIAAHAVVLIASA